MANPVAFGANSDPFRGGSFTPGTVPALNGAIGAASTGASLQGSVTAGTPMLARNNRGSNITIPYARVVLHPAAQTALGPAPDAFHAASDSTTTTLHPLGGVANEKIVETEGLFTGRVAFVLGRRGTGYTGAVTGSISGPGASVPFRQANQLAQFAVGGADVNTMQRMCSFEYLERYFHHVLKTKVIAIGGTDFPAGADDVPPTISSDYLTLKDEIKSNSLTNIDGQKLLDKLSERKYKGASSEIAKAANKGDNLKTSGIFLADDGPFLRGKTLETSLDFVLATGQPRKDLPAAIGDIIAFDRLQQLIAGTGACDWVPDGIVHSKLSQGDKMLDDELDSRDGQLYNVTVGGPAITSSWTEDKHMQVLPLDKVFVVIVADVWSADGTTAADAHINGYEAKLLDQADGSAVRSETEKKNLLDATGTKALITNMRVRLMTSSEMVSCSALKDAANAAFPGKIADVAAKAEAESIARKAALALGKDTAGVNADVTAAGVDVAKIATAKQKLALAAYESMTRDRHSRLGLKLGGDGGVSEYIIGGWCIGTVLDAAAARSSANGVSLVGAVKRQRTAHASNIKVKVEWWSADKMYRSYMNVKGGLATRYNGMNKGGRVVKTGSLEGKVLAPALKR